MARRSAPPGSGPAYIPASFGSSATSSRGRLNEKENEGALGRFYREQIIAPQYLAGNISILTSVVMFGAGIIAVRRNVLWLEGRWMKGQEQRKGLRITRINAEIIMLSPLPPPQRAPSY
ncbi:uncharacterized protein FOMMEDRAFT_28259 [Fomitiporia mediterranea MF3/22]|uniref:uncharacterized protein n=1 Tax=Fomitiporia mediterranea (strain MF3/22) TaxID=694068 RepID=UPI0004407403|nr:uncharacterized protein FOMMEDRAFT_28259 [Fomitiporia mediterranea MF3/22]EJD04613.1 hypothetical protein FOMMEDRAFT_28259 [Fomitiporia mediterranea MF3/22]